MFQRVPRGPPTHSWFLGRGGGEATETGRWIQAALGIFGSTASNEVAHIPGSHSHVLFGKHTLLFKIGNHINSHDSLRGSLPLHCFRILSNGH